MQTAQCTWTPDAGWSDPGPGALEGADLVLVFAGRDVLEQAPLADLAAAWPEARIVGCSTAGEIRDTEVRDGSLVATAIRFGNTGVSSAEVQVDAFAGDGAAAGRAVADALPHEDLRHVFILSDGLAVNGSALVAGLTGGLPDGVVVSGGLSGDGDRFERTLVVSGPDAAPGRVVAVGLHGDAIRVGSASMGGWDPFGPERRITRSRGNVLFELDGKPALELYRSYLAEHADGLPATGLLFPMTVRATLDETPVVRTILAIDEAEGSLTFAGDVPEGALARLMRANFERLVDGAAMAGESSAAPLADRAAELAILISCVGRKLVLKQRIEEEVEAVRDAVGAAAALTGFYSYGEISPFAPGARCELHNQTMTVTTLSEA